MGSYPLANEKTYQNIECLANGGAPLSNSDVERFMNIVKVITFIISTDGAMACDSITSHITYRSITAAVELFHKEHYYQTLLLLTNTLSYDSSSIIFH